MFYNITVGKASMVYYNVYEDRKLYPDGPPARKCMVCLALDARQDDWHCGHSRCISRWEEILGAFRVVGERAIKEEIESKHRATKQQVIYQQRLLFEE